MPTLTGITIYPVKSLDGLSLSESLVLPCGALANDRRWRLVDAEGQVVNAKRTARFHPIRAAFTLADISADYDGCKSVEKPFSAGNFSDTSARERHNDFASAGVDLSGSNTITLWFDEFSVGDKNLPLATETFPLVPGSDGPCGWLSEALAENVFLQERAEGGFPDDRDAPGPTLISTESLTEVARWFAWDLAEARRRFRMNLELTGDSTTHAHGKIASCENNSFFCGPFWEDTLAFPASMLPERRDLAAAILPTDPYAGFPPAEPQAFLISDVGFRAAGLCRRCVVPGRNSCTGRVTTIFQDAFEARRSRGLRPDVDSRSWSSAYCLGVNSSLCQSGSEKKAIRIGDQLILAGMPRN